MTLSSASGSVISVFGGSSPQTGEPAYSEALFLGSLLARAGYTVATGGYMGTMAATSQGAAEAGGQVIGVTCDQIEQFRSTGPNQWVTQEIRYVMLRDRLLHLVTENEGMIVLPGGIGTLSEMSLAWSLLQVGEITPRPLILLGALWHATIAAFVRDEYVRADHAKLLKYAFHPDEAVAMLSAQHERDETYQ